MSAHHQYKIGNTLPAPPLFSFSLLSPATLVFPLICCPSLCSEYLALALGLDVGYCAVVYEVTPGASIGAPLQDLL